jgi:hypothetical protein
LLAPYRRQGAQRVAKSVMISGIIAESVAHLGSSVFCRDPKLAFI